MPLPTIAICKFVGTISLGLLTGVSTTHSTLTLPSLLALPTAPTAHTTLSTLTHSTTHLTRPLRHLSTLALLAAYFLSPRRNRHPYLLYTSLLALLSGPAVDYAFARAAQPTARAPSFAAEAGDVNGEQVRQAVERMRAVEGVRAGVAGAAFAMVVVGIWGDGA